jgi:hypothetical protein
MYFMGTNTSFYAKTKQIVNPFVPIYMPILASSSITPTCNNIRDRSRYLEYGIIFELRAQIFIELGLDFLPLGLTFLLHWV